MAAYDKRIFLSWDEAATVLGMDAEGLRQALIWKWSPTRDFDAENWLRVYLPTPDGEYMTRLQFSGREAAYFWNKRGNYYRNTEGKDALDFSDGLQLQLRGSDGLDSWDSHHGGLTGWSHCFAVSGSTLVVDPESVRYACIADGRFDTLAVAPKGWCAEGYPHDLHFVVVRTDNSFYRSKPESLFEAGRFLREEVAALAEQSKDTERPRRRSGAVPSPLRSDYEENLLRVIAGLWALSGLPVEHNTTADKLSGLFDSWQWDKPAKSTIADRILKRAAELPGARVRTSG